MTNNARHADDTTITLTLPRAAREIAARLTSRLARKGNGMSQHATAAVEALLSPNDRVELTYLQAVAVSSQCYAECARIESARSRGELTARQQLVDEVIVQVTGQACPQMLATPVAVDGVTIGTPAPGTFRGGSSFPPPRRFEKPGI